MSFWRRLFGRAAQEPSPKGEEDSAGRAEQPQAKAAAGAADDDGAEQRLERLRRVGEPGGATVDEALAALRRDAASTAQAKVLQAILQGLREEPDHDPLRAACANLLAARGQTERALSLVAGCRSVEPMMLAAELYAGEGDSARAVGMIERVLARDIDTPGARERHERWCAQLGRQPRQAAVDAGATVVAPTLEQSAFRLLREVARGGAGTIYEAEDELLGRHLAFKVYHQKQPDRAQIEREARCAARFSGPGVLRIFDAHPAEGWLALEWAKRGSLRDILRRGDVAEMLPLSGWLPELLAALARVHDEGLVHSDLKPGNILYRSPAEPLLADFGICLPRGERSLAGTPGYLAPERLAGQPAAPADDVYAIGRIIEDVQVACAAAKLTPEPADAAIFEQIAPECLRDATARPADATELLALFEQAQAEQPPR